MHVVGLVGFLRNHAVQTLVGAQGIIIRTHDGWVLQVVGGQIGEQLLDQEDRVLLAIGREVRHAGGRGVGQRPPQLLEGDRLVCHRLHDVGPGHEHIAGALDHDNEIGERRRVDRAAGRRSQDHADLRHDPGRQGIAQEDIGIPAERNDALLDACAARVVQADHRCAVLHREVHHLADLFGMGLAQRAADHREVL